MANKFVKKTWVNDETRLNEENMNDLEQRIYDAIGDTDSDVEVVTEEVEKIKTEGAPIFWYTLSNN